MSIKYTPKELEKIEQMAKDGYTIRHIAKDMGRTVTAIRDVIKRYRFKYTKTRAVYSQEIVDKIREGLKNGKSLADISSELDMPAATVGRWARMNNLVPVKNRTIVSEEKLEQVVDLLNRGYNKKQIGVELGVSSSAISDWCIKYDLCEPTCTRKSVQNKDLEFRLQRIQSLLDKDFTYRQIGKVIGISASMIGIYVKQYDLKSNRKYHRTTPTLREQVKCLTEDGYSPMEIADILNIENTEVYYIKRGFR